VHAVEALRSGYTDAVVAGGTESMSNAPYVLKGARWGYRMGHAEVFDLLIGEGLTCALEGCHMGMTAEEIVSPAVRGGGFKAEIVPVEVPQRKGPPIVVDTDEYPKAGTTLRKLSALRPAFKSGGTVTAGNASGINDGAAALIVTAKDYADRIGRQPLARVLSYAVAGVDPMIMGMGPVPAVRKALTRADLLASQIDLFELNEAFAGQALAVMRELELDSNKVNVRGGAIALGHPIGASGARLLTTLIYALRDRGGGRGVAALCIGGGMGIAMVIEAGD
jgi:acetyl-CoA C-acetyltransferase